MNEFAAKVPVKYKRFLVFCYADYYPYGGLNDVEAAFDNKDDALLFADGRPDDNVEVFDCLEQEKIYSK